MRYERGEIAAVMSLSRQEDTGSSVHTFRMSGFQQERGNFMIMGKKIECVCWILIVE